MRILEIAGSGSVGMNEMGPVSTVICNLSNNFNELGHAVTIVDAGTMDHRDRLSNKITLINVNCKPRTRAESPSPNRYKKIFNRWRNEYKFVKEVVSRVDLSEFEIVHLHECRSTFILQKTRREGLVYTSHTPSWCSGPQDENLKAGLKGMVRMGPRVEKNVIRNSCLTVALGDYLKKNVPNANIEVIPNGIDLKHWNPIDKRGARRRLGLRDDEFILIFVGRISPVKGVDILLKAVRESLSRLKKLKVIIIGSLTGAFGSREGVTTYSQGIIQDADGLPVVIKGFINNQSEEFSSYLSAADLAVVPSMREPQGLFVLEALAMGKPVVASRTGGIPQMLNDNIGCLFEPGNSAALAEQVQRLYENRDRLELMSRSSRAFVEKNFTWEATALKHIAAFQKILTKTTQ